MQTDASHAHPNSRFDEAMTRGMRLALRIGLAILAITALISLWAGLRNALGPLGSQDNQWGPSRALLSHQDPYRLVLEQHEHPSRPAPFPLSQDPNYPAFGLVMLWPYASLPWPLAKVVWAVLNVFFTGLIVGGLFHLFLSSKPKWTLILVTGMLMTGTPFRVQIGNGQQALFSLGLFVLSIIFAEEEKDLLSAICLAASLFKYTVTLPLLPFFLVRRQWRIVLLAAGIDLGLTFFAAAWAQASPWQMMIGPVRSALLTTGQGYIDIRSIFGHIDMEAWSWLWIPAGGCMLLIAAAFCQRYGNGNELLVLSLMSVVSLLVFFHLAYDAVVLIFPLMYIFGHEHEETASNVLSVLFALCMCCSWFLDAEMFDPGRWYYWFVVLLFYTTLGYGFHLLRTTKNEAPTHPGELAEMARS